ncbi:hypothetical protein V1509DRAFT_624049 [Lipomyces kononenkoae]
MSHKHSASSTSTVSDHDADEADFIVPAESIESTNVVETATAASLIGTRPTQVHVNPRRVSGTPSVSSTVSSSTVTPANVDAIQKDRDSMPPPSTIPRTVYAAPEIEHGEDAEMGPPSPTASTTSFFTSTSGADHSVHETDAYVDALDDRASSRASVDTVLAAGPVADSGAVAREVAPENLESTRSAMTSSDVSKHPKTAAASGGSTVLEKAELAGSAPIASSAIRNGITKFGAAGTAKVPVTISEKDVLPKSRWSLKWKLILLALILAIAIGVGVGVGVGVGTRKHQASNSAVPGTSSSALSSSNSVTPSSIGTLSIASSTTISASEIFASIASSGVDLSATPSSSSSTSSSSASSTTAFSTFSTVTTTTSSGSGSLSSPPTTSGPSSDNSPTRTSSSSPTSLSVFRSTYTTTFPTSVVQTRTYLGFPFVTTVEVTTRAVRTATYTSTLS